MENPTRFVILGSQRTGTTLVRTSLSSHPDIHCVGEAFNLGKRPYKEPGGYWHFTHQGIGARLMSLALPRQSTTRYFDYLFADQAYEAIGFKLMLNHYQSRPYIWPALRDMDIRALLVTRRNILKTLISRLTAAKSGVYHVSETLGQRTAVKNWTARRLRINPSTLIQKLDLIESEYEKWFTVLKRDQVPFWHIVYEDHVADTESSNQSILHFLGVRYQPLRSDLKKVNPDQLQDLIENYDEIAATLDGTKHAIHLTT